ncbi:MAG: hypothetical protein V9G04_10935 [Nocardioides sp.]
MSESIDEPVADLSRSPLPTERRLRCRKSVVRQAVRFAVINLRMVLKGHH